MLQTTCKVNPPSIQRGTSWTPLSIVNNKRPMHAYAHEVAPNWPHLQLVWLVWFHPPCGFAKFYRGGVARRS